MRPGPEIRAHVHQGLATGRLWRLVDDRARLLGASDGGECHVCSHPISRGQAFGVARATALVPVPVHLECYMFWLHACGRLEHEPITCAACRRLIPPHAERTVVRDAAYHMRCRDRIDDPDPALGLLAPQESARSNR
jgi:hypothetical protein